MKRNIACFIIISLLLMYIGNAKVTCAKVDIQSTVKDISGTKRKLTIDSVKNVGTKLEDFYYPSEYGQVANGHYYYMRQTKSNQFTIYPDAGKKVGSFKEANREPGYMRYGFGWYGGKFYLDIRNDEMKMIKVAVVDLKQKTTKTICTCTVHTDDAMNKYLNHTEVYLYQNKIYAMHGLGDDKEFKVEEFDMSSGSLLYTFSFPKPGKNEIMNFINIADGKIYYAIERLTGKNQVTFRCRDMETNKDKKVFRCNLSSKNVHKNYYHYGDNTLIMKGKEIYYYGTYGSGGYWLNGLVYSIPSAGGKMQQIGKGEIRDFAYNNKYYFYIDKKFSLHRQNRKTGKDKVISGIKAIKVDCTKKGLYVQKYDKWFDDDDASGFEYANADYGHALYFMNFKGGNVKKIAQYTMGHMSYEDWE